MDSPYRAGSLLQAAKNIRVLAAMSDAEFAETYLKELSLEEREEFLRACPDFPGQFLPRK